MVIPSLDIYKYFGCNTSEVFTQSTLPTKWVILKSNHIKHL